MYWDSSALVPLIVQEAETEARRNLLMENPDILTWWGSRVECASALNRLARDGALDAPGLTAAMERLRALSAGWIEVEPREVVRTRAIRLLRLHELRAADAFQLAAALVASREQPEQQGFACADDQLSRAAQQQGFRIC